MASKGVTFVNNGASAGTFGPFTWPGARAVLVVGASTAPASVQLQLLQRTGAVNVGTAMTASGVSVGMDLPAGNYQVVVTGTPAALDVVLASVSYM